METTLTTSAQSQESDPTSAKWMPPKNGRPKGSKTKRPRMIGQAIPRPFSAPSLTAEQRAYLDGLPDQSAFQDIEWVSKNQHHDQITPQQCPSARAWEMWHHAKAYPKAFWEKVFPDGVVKIAKAESGNEGDDQVVRESELQAGEIATMMESFRGEVDRGVVSGAPAG